MPRRKLSKPFPKISAMLNGAVCASYARCGKANCRCANGQLHGPYYHRYQWHNGRMIKEYVRLADVEATRKACDAYRAMQAQIRASNRRFYSMLANLRSQLRELEL
jgi:hypothetical protein